MPTLRSLMHPFAVAVLLISLGLAAGIAILAPWSGRAVWFAVWGVLAYGAAVFAVRPRAVPLPAPPAEAPARTVDVQEDLVRLTEEALRQLNNPALLASCGLIARLPRTLARALEEGAIKVSDATPLEQASAVRLLLEASIERLKPSQPDGAATQEPELLQYAILHEEYVRGRPNNQIMVRHNIAERTLYRYRRQGIQALAADLATREQQVPQAQPVH